MQLIPHFVSNVRARSLGQIAAMLTLAGGLFLGLLLLLQQPVWARPFPPVPVDITQFPNIRAQVPCTITPISLPGTAISLSAAEDEQLLANLSVTQVITHPKTQILFLLDLPAGSQEELRPIADTLAHFFTYYSATVSITDGLGYAFSAYAPLTNGAVLDTLQPWTTELASVIDAVNIHSVVATGTTALADLLDDAYRQFDFNVSARRTVVLFSDGADIRSADRLQRILRTYAEQQVKIHAIFIETGGDNPFHLKNIAGSTDGVYVAGLEQTAAISLALQPLAAPEAICTLRYRTTQPHPGQLVITESNPKRVYTLTIPYVAVSPPLVTLQSSQLKALTNTLTTGIPLSLAVELQWALLDQTQRQVPTATYSLITVTNQPRILSVTTLVSSPTTVTLVLGELVTGAFRLNAVVSDELGLAGHAELLFQAIAPPTPAPTATVMPTPTLLPFLRQVDTTIQKNVPNSSLNFSLLSLLLFAAIVILLFFEEGSTTDLPSFPGTSSPVQALLYRDRATPGLPLRQVVKIDPDRKLMLPDDLLNARPAMVELKLRELHQQISTRNRLTIQDSTYQLEVLGETIPSAKIEYTDKDNVPQVVTPRQGTPQQLHHRSLIHISENPRVVYRFIDLNAAKRLGEMEADESGGGTNHA